VLLFVAIAQAQTDINFSFADIAGDTNGGGFFYDAEPNDCSWVDYNALTTALRQVVCGSTSACPDGFPGTSANNGGFGLNMWATVVNRAGIVCAVTYSGPTYGSQWPGSRAISAQKANTGNSFSLDAFAISSANLYNPTQPGGTLFGLQESNPVDVRIYHGDANDYGTPCANGGGDPMCGARPGGINVFGGGLGLYASDGSIVGGLGVSGDSSCADHNISWKLRHALGWDYVPGGFGDNNTDNIIYPATVAWGHPECSSAATAVAATLTTDYPVSTVV